MHFLLISLQDPDTVTYLKSYRNSGQRLQIRSQALLLQSPWSHQYLLLLLEIVLESDFMDSYPSTTTYQVGDLTY